MNRLDEAWAAFERKDHAEAERLYQSVLGDAARSDEEQGGARFGLGYVLAFTGRHDEARGCFEALHQEALERQDLEAAHRALHQVGMVERLAGRWASARQTFERERTLIAQLGDPDLAVSINAYELGLVALHEGRMEASRVWFERSLTCAQRTTDLVAVDCAHRGLGDWYRQQGDEESARAAWQAAREVFGQAQDLKSVTDMNQRLSS